MSILDPLRFKILVTTFLCFGLISSFAQCKNIEAGARVAETSAGTSIIIDFKNSRTDLFKISLFGPNKNNVLNSEKIEFNNLSSGKYLIVIVGKRDDDNYCPK